jgi:hypothetical protein
MLSAMEIEDMRDRLRRARHYLYFWRLFLALNVATVANALTALFWPHGRLVWLALMAGCVNALAAAWSVHEIRRIRRWMRFGEDFLRFDQAVDRGCVVQADALADQLDAHVAKLRRR